MKKSNIAFSKKYGLYNLFILMIANVLSVYDRILFYFY